PRRRHVTPADDDAARLSLPEDDLPPPLRGPSAAPRATVTPIATRLAPLGPPTVVAGPGSHAQPEPEQERRHAHAAAQAAAGSMEAPPRSASREAQARADGREAQARPGSRDAQTSPGSREAQARPGNREAQARAGSRDMPQQGSAGRETAIEEDSAAQSPPPARERPVRKAAGGRSRRSSVPSWDEIMFGNSRQPD
ncbi:MAG TPA: septation protein SepH, partial [Streptosporangiaceae bacterium]